MADIASDLNTIKNAVYGKDMRQAIYSAIDKVNTSISGNNASLGTKIETAKEVVISRINDSEEAVSNDILSAKSELLTNINSNAASLSGSIADLIGDPTSSEGTIAGDISDVYDKASKIIAMLGSFNPATGDPTIENQISNAKSSLLAVMGTPNTTVSGDISTKSASIMNKLGSGNSSIEDQINAAKNSLSGDISTKSAAITNKLGSGNSTIEDQIEIAERNVLNKIGINLSDQKYTVKMWFESIEENISDLSDQLTEAEADLGRQIEDNRVEFEGRYQQLSDKMDDLQRNLLMAYKSVADEAAIGDSNFAGNISIVPQATVLETVFAGNITQGG